MNLENAIRAHLLRFQIHIFGQTTIKENISNKSNRQVNCVIEDEFSNVEDNLMLNDNISQFV